MGNFTELKETGVTIYRNIIEETLIEDLKKAMDISFAKHKHIQQKLGNEIIVPGVALNSLFDHDSYFVLLNDIQSKLGKQIEDNFFKSKYILNSFSCLSTFPNHLNFSSKVHRDIKCYTGKIPIMLNLLVMIDDFTHDNGPTLLLPNSHKKPSPPPDSYFQDNCIKATGKAGDIVIFDSNTFHASSPNYTVHERRAIPITLSKSFVKPLFDYIPSAVLSFLDDDTLSLLGYNSRIPSTLEQFYLPAEQRFYKPNQD